MEEEIIEYLTSFGMNEQKAKENVQLLIENNELIDFYSNMQK